MCCRGWVIEGVPREICWIGKIVIDDDYCKNTHTIILYIVLFDSSNMVNGTMNKLWVKANSRIIVAYMLFGLSNI